MQLPDYIDIISRSRAEIEKSEVDSLQYIIERSAELYALRRGNKIEKKFWNYFWHRWNYSQLREAHNQAFKDMAQDQIFKDFKENLIRTINFEKAVVFDILNYNQLRLSKCYIDFGEPNFDLFFYLQSYVQRFMYNSESFPDAFSSNYKAKKGKNKKEKRKKKSHLSNKKG